jgi:tRNA threonylcarbamoyladenosine dehydratase
MPAIFGLTCANFVLMALAEYPVPQPSFTMSSKLRPRIYAEIHTALKSKYDSHGSSTEQPKCPFSADDVAYIVEEVFRGRSVLEPFQATRLTLIKWRVDTGLQWGNVVCMTKAEAIEHEKRVLKGKESVEEVYDEEVVSRVAEIWEEEKEMRAVRWGKMYTTKA